MIHLLRRLAAPDETRHSQSPQLAIHFKLLAFRAAGLLPGNRRSEGELPSWSRQRLNEPALHGTRLLQRRRNPLAARLPRFLLHFLCSQTMRLKPQRGNGAIFKADFTRWPALMHEWNCDTAPVPLSFVHDAASSESSAYR